MQMLVRGVAGGNWEIMHYKDRGMTLTESEWSAGKANREKLPAQAFDGYRISGMKLPLKYIIQRCFSFTVCEEEKKLEAFRKTRYLRENDQENEISC